MRATAGLEPARTEVRGSVSALYLPFDHVAAEIETLMVRKAVRVSSSPAGLAGVKGLVLVRFTGSQAPR